MIQNEATKPLNAVKITVVDAPAVSLAPNENAAELLLHFFRALGWNGEDLLDPCKIRTTKCVYKQLYDQMFERCPDHVGVGMLMVNRGPGTDEFIPPGKVHLIDGWITPAQNEGDNDHAS